MDQDPAQHGIACRDGAGDAKSRRVKTVSIEEAKILVWDQINLTMKTVVIKDGDCRPNPAWRHALISYPHPAAKCGLVVLDTPGLNALGTEPGAHAIDDTECAIVFLLAMDTGVTSRSRGLAEIRAGGRHAHRGYQ
jgi:hypothetical protein